MAYSGSSITAQQSSDLASDYPLAFASHAIRNARNDAAFAAEWRQSGSFASGANATNASFPTSNSYDFQHFVDSRPTSSQTLWYLMFNLGATTATFDTVAILGHNLGTSSASCLVQIADDNAFSSNLSTIATFVPSDNKRLISVSLGTSTEQSFTGVQYLRLRIEAASGFIPRIGELWLGKRRQLHKKPRLGFNSDYATSRTADFASESGVIRRFVRNKNRQDVTASFITSTSAQASTVVDLYNDSEQGTNPIIWCQTPNSNAQFAKVMYLNDPTIPGGEQARQLRNWQFDLRENAPFYGNE